MAHQRRCKFGPLTCGRIEDTVQAHNEIFPVAVFRDIANKSDTLPEIFHGELAYQLITANSRGSNAILVTHDRDIIRYGEAEHVSVLAA